MRRSEGFSRSELFGREASDFTLDLIDGKQITLSAHRGSVVLIDFWATWCGPCVKALPKMLLLAEQYKDRGLVVIGVGRDRKGDEEKIRNLFAKHELAYPTGIDVSGIANVYKVRSIPCLVLVDANGIIQRRRIGFSRDSLDAVRKDIESVLDGHDLESAKPMTEEELQEVKRAASEHRRLR